jgi:SPX domain protein involved in polyphosphate accumulation
MSFRRELKSIIFKNKIQKLKEWIFQNKGEILHPERNINSLYLDNSSLSMYRDSLEGSVPRKKIRIRNYNEQPIFDSKNNKLELKISSAEGRFKTIKKAQNINLFNFKISDMNYGLCTPNICITYKRIYYNIQNIRLTIDRNIVYRRVKLGRISNFLQIEPFNVVEIKYKNNTFDNLVKTFPFHFVRFSKYSRGVEFINKKHGL